LTTQTYIAFAVQIVNLQTYLYNKLFGLFKCFKKSDIIDRMYSKIESWKQDAKMWANYKYGHLDSESRHICFSRI